MRKNELIKRLQAFEGNPVIYAEDRATEYKLILYPITAVWQEWGERGRVLISHDSDIGKNDE